MLNIPRSSKRPSSQVALVFGELALLHLAQRLDDEAARSASRVDDLVLGGDLHDHHARADHALWSQELALARLQRLGAEGLEGLRQHVHRVAEDAPRCKRVDNREDRLVGEVDLIAVIGMKDPILLLYEVGPVLLADGRSRLLDHRVLVAVNAERVGLVAVGPLAGPRVGVHLDQHRVQQLAKLVLVARGARVRHDDGCDYPPQRGRQLRLVWLAQVIPRRRLLRGLGEIVAGCRQRCVLDEDPVVAVRLVHGERLRGVRPEAHARNRLVGEVADELHAPLFDRRLLELEDDLQRMRLAGVVGERHEIRAAAHGVFLAALALGQVVRRVGDRPLGPPPQTALLRNTLDSHTSRRRSSVRVAGAGWSGMKVTFL
jgi:hypothetical protein